MAHTNREPARLVSIDQLLTADEVAGILKITPGALAQLRWRDKGPDYIQFGRSVRYRVGAVNEYIDKHSVNLSGSRRAS